MIDKNPAIGRIIILKRDPKVYRGHFAGYGGIITREPKMQIYFKDKNGQRHQHLDEGKTGALHSPCLLIRCTAHDHTPLPWVRQRRVTG